MFVKLSDVPNLSEPLAPHRNQFCALHGDWFPQRDAYVEASFPGRYFCPDAVAAIKADESLVNSLQEGLA